MRFDALHYRYPSRRTLVYGRRGLVATSTPLAAQAGLRILREGGNAIDAAVATAAALTVTEPTSNGIGGDAFALFSFRGSLYGLNGSGWSPALLTPGLLKEKGFEKMPAHGWLPVTVPGIPASWAALVSRFGRLSLSQVVAPAVEYATEGYPVSPVTARFWERAVKRYREVLKGEEFAPWFSLFAPQGRGPSPGEIWSSPEMGQTLALIGETDARDFYEGSLAEAIEDFAVKTGGALRLPDLAEFAPRWVEPLGVDYRGKKIWELPPNGQGMAALMALNILSELPGAPFDSAENIHYSMEAMKLAFSDCMAYLADPSSMPFSPDVLLSKSYAAERARLIGDKALDPFPGEPQGSGTVYLATADGEGNMVSYIQSNYMGFGSGIVIPGTGIALQNRGHGFSLEEAHPNVLAPRKRPYHTIIPAFLTESDNTPLGPFGVMGGFMQPQGHLQVASALIDGRHNPQEALDRPRWQWHQGKRITCEAAFDSATLEKLRAMGHDIEKDPEGFFGRGEMILKTEEGSLCGATDHRADGTVAAW
ncbi:MAG TPA: gamma-glutamyltransferase family protein [Candidatus Mcinerneyibacteriales bacterium]|nr:gamma-glutamyltransferase family protein [Candidatus Mcinerneyibacteriales bacterium]